ncbi:CDP-alcohol phosphatidyltransferase family protein [Antarctobacter jejuensis]|uniref:CDP-alcohol phosphatidyltransferase family protein n=1 Tax=Antarctobacter jejuensis TaxID=1439938 RepID=UPI003FD1FCC2
MFDAQIRPLIDPALDAVGQKAAQAGVTANLVTLIGLTAGVASAVAIAVQAYGLGLLLIVISRLADGLDGAVARASKSTDFGGFLDITCDFLFYGLVPLAFVIAEPTQNGIAGAWLLASFYFNGATFLGYAIMAERHGLETSARGSKSLYFTGGLLEGTETIGFFVLLCLFPAYFVPMAWLFGALCFVTAVSRVLLARQVFSN